MSQESSDAGQEDVDVSAKEAADQAAQAAQMAASNINRFLRLQAQARPGLLMVAHQENIGTQAQNETGDS